MLKNLERSGEIFSLLSRDLYPSRRALLKPSRTPQERLIHAFSPARFRPLNLWNQRLSIRALFLNFSHLRTKPIPTAGLVQHREHDFRRQNRKRALLVQLITFNQLFHGLFIPNGEQTVIDFRPQHPPHGVPEFADKLSTSSQGNPTPRRGSTKRLETQMRHAGMYNHSPVSLRPRSQLGHVIVHDPLVSSFRGMDVNSNPSPSFHSYRFIERQLDQFSPARR